MSSTRQTRSSSKRAAEGAPEPAPLAENQNAAGLQAKTVKRPAKRAKKSTVKSVPVEQASANDELEYSTDDDDDDEDDEDYIEELLDEEAAADAAVLADTLHPDIESDATTFRSPTRYQILYALEAKVNSLPPHEAQPWRAVITSFLHDSSRNADPALCYRTPQSDYDAALDGFLKDFGEGPLQHDRGRYTELATSATNVDWSWGTTEEVAGPIMAPDNKSWSVERAREMGLGNKTISMRNCSFRRWSKTRTNTKPMKTDQAYARAWTYLSNLHEKKARLELGRQLSLVQGKETEWVLMEDNQKEVANALQYEAQLLSRLHQAYGQANYARLRPVQAIKSTIVVDIPFVGFKYPQATTLTMEWLNGQSTERASLTCRVWSMAALLLGGATAAMNIISGVALFHTLNCTPELPNLDAFIPRSLDSDTEAHIRKVRHWATVYPSAATGDDIFMSDSPSAWRFLLGCLFLRQTQAVIRQVLPTLPASYTLEHVQALASAANLSLPKVLAKCWTKQRGLSAKSVADGTISQELWEQIEARRAERRAEYAQNRDKMAAIRQKGAGASEAEKVQLAAYDEARGARTAEKRVKYAEHRDKMAAIRQKGAEASGEEKLELAAYDEALEKDNAAHKVRNAQKRERMQVIRQKGAGASEEEKLQLAAYDQARTEKKAARALKRNQIEAIRLRGPEASEAEKLQLAAYDEARKKYNAARNAKNARERDQMDAIRRKGVEASKQEKLELAAYDEALEKDNAAHKARHARMRDEAKAIRQKGVEASEEEQLQLAAYDEAREAKNAKQTAKYAQERDQQRDQQRDEMESIRQKGPEASEQERLELAAYDEAKRKSDEPRGGKHAQDRERWDKKRGCLAKDAKKLRKKIASGIATDEEKLLVQQRDEYDKYVKEQELKRMGCSEEQAKEIERKIKEGTASDEEKQAYQKRLNYLADAKRRNDKRRGRSN